MHFTSIFAVAATLFAATTTALPTLAIRKSTNTTATAYANVIAINNSVRGPNDPPATKTALKIPFGKLTTFEDLPITGFHLEGITIDVDVIVKPQEKQVVCQRYRDQFGVQPGSLPFNTTTDALVSTNSVDFGWVLCYIKPVSY
ncbi:hypothetical protein G7046_g5439 [Stylonectria norvegica]|nr:hypothetical protein G7046_g5439 [Stylonectria norvegica]